MPRNISSPLLAAISSGAFLPAILARITLSNGTIYGYTSADEVITVEGVDHFPTEAVEMSSLASSVGASVDNSSIKGIARDNRVDEDEIDAGSFDGAEYVLTLVDRLNLSAGELILQKGSLGELSIEDGRFEFEQRGLSSRIRVASSDETTKLCRCRRLGDAQCKVNLAGTVQGRSIRATRTVLTAPTAKEVRFSSEGAPTGFYTYGYVRFISGANDGIEREIKDHTLLAGSVAKVELRLPFPYAIDPSDQAVLTAGCNRKLKYDDKGGVTEPRVGSTCEQFGNGVNFHGEHFLPGNEQITQVGRQ